MIWKLSETNSQFSPRSLETYNPAFVSESIKAYTLLASAADIVKPVLPRPPSGNPLLYVISVQFSPPSTDFHIPLSGPPVFGPQALRSNSHMVANNSSGFEGFITKSITPALSLLNKTFFQVFPPSTVLKTPRSGFGPKA